MARRCSVCEHQNVAAINSALLAGPDARPPFRKIAKSWGLSLSSVYRHTQDHLPVTSVDGAEQPAPGQTATSESRVTHPGCGVTIGSSPAEIPPDPPSAVAARESGQVAKKTLVTHMKKLHVSAQEIYKTSKAAGRLETALRAHKECRADVEMIAKLEGLLPGAGGDSARRELSVQQLDGLLRAQLREMSPSNRARVLRAEPSLREFIPDLIDLTPDQFEVVTDEMGPA